MKASKLINKQKHKAYRCLRLQPTPRTPETRCDDERGEKEVGIRKAGDEDNDGQGDFDEYIDVGDAGWY